MNAILIDLESPKPLTDTSHRSYIVKQRNARTPPSLADVHARPSVLERSKRIRKRIKKA
jgi:hypothetical protein